MKIILRNIEAIWHRLRLVALSSHGRAKYLRRLGRRPVEQAAIVWLERARNDRDPAISILALELLSNAARARKGEQVGEVMWRGIQVVAASAKAEDTRGKAQQLLDRTKVDFSGPMTAKKRGNTVRVVSPGARLARAVGDLAQDTHGAILAIRDVLLDVVDPASALESMSDGDFDKLVRGTSNVLLTTTHSQGTRAFALDVLCFCVSLRGESFHSHLLQRLMELREQPRAFHEVHMEGTHDEYAVTRTDVDTKNLSNLCKVELVRRGLVHEDRDSGAQRRSDVAHAARRSCEFCGATEGVDSVRHGSMWDVSRDLCPKCRKSFE